MSEFESDWLRDYAAHRNALRERRIAATSQTLIEFMAGFGSKTLKIIYNSYAGERGYPKLPPAPVIDKKMAELLQFLGAKFEAETGQLGGRSLLALEQQLREFKENLFG